MSACGRLRVASTFSRMGMANAAVFPVPVCAWAKRARPAWRTGMAMVWTGVGAMKPSSSMAREMSGWIASSPKRAVGGARVNVSPVLIYMLTGETLAVNELFQWKSIQFGEDLFGIGLGSGSGLAARGIAEGDDRRDRAVSRRAEVLAHPVVFVGPDRVRAAADPECPGRDHHVLRDASGVEAQAFVQKDDCDRDGAAVEVPRRHDHVRQIVPVLSVLENDEPPRLRVLAAPGGASGLKDLRNDVLRHRTIRVLADLALRDDSQVSIHLEPSIDVIRGRPFRVPSLAKSTNRGEEFHESEDPRYGCSRPGDRELVRRSVGGR